MIAVGVARPKAHGQAITKTLTATVIAKVKVCPMTKYQKSPETSAIAMTTGTKTADT